MVNIVVEKSNGNINISVKGHAGYLWRGQDIVCAGVSATIQSALLGLEEISKNYPKHVTYIEGETE